MSCILFVFNNTTGGDCCQPRALLRLHVEKGGVAALVGVAFAHSQGEERGTHHFEACSH